MPCWSGIGLPLGPYVLAGWFTSSSAPYGDKNRVRVNIISFYTFLREKLHILVQFKLPRPSRCAACVVNELVQQVPEGTQPTFYDASANMNGSVNWS